MRIVANHPVLLALIMVIVLGVATWIGQHLASGDETDVPLGPMQGAVLVLAGLMLGFSFSMALARYEHRRSLVINEANAIGTTYLRAGMLAPNLRDEARTLLRRYVDARLAYLRATSEKRRLAGGVAEARLQDALWRNAEQAAAAAPTPVTVGFVTSLNQMIDIEAERVATRHDRLPGAVWLVLIVVTVGASLFTGMLMRGRHRVVLAVLPVMLAVILGLIADLDTPRTGLLTVSQYSMERLAAGLKSGGIPLPPGQ
ncbi:MAG TPA: hypothetical protein VF286_13275 [Acidiphilium sp.]